MDKNVFIKKLFARAAEMGVTSFKVFMVYDFGVTDGIFYEILEKAKKLPERTVFYAMHEKTPAPVGLAFLCLFYSSMR